MHTPETYTHKGIIKVHLHINFGLNMIKIYGVMIDFSHKRRLKVCHSYRVNHWKELVETLHVHGVAIIGVPFCVWKGIRKKTTEI